MILAFLLQINSSRFLDGKMLYMAVGISISFSHPYFLFLILSYVLIHNNHIPIRNIYFITEHNHQEIIVYIKKQYTDVGNKKCLHYLARKTVR